MSEPKPTEAPAAGRRLALPPSPILYLVGSGRLHFPRLSPAAAADQPARQPAGAVYGYTTMLWKLADGLSKADGPTHMAVILDASEHTHRNEMYDQYKAHRPPPPEDLVPQFPLIRVATRAFSIPCIEERGWKRTTSSPVM
jgi:DNA polymerase-1